MINWIQRKSSNFNMNIKKRSNTSSSSSNTSPTTTATTTPRTSLIMDNVVSYASDTQIGEGNKINEDVIVPAISLGEATTKEQQNEFLDSIIYTAVFDGCKGNTCSDFYSKKLHEYIGEIFLENNITSFQEFCSLGLIEKAFEKCEENFNLQNPTSTSGSCGITALVNENTFLLSWVGTCRAVLWSGGTFQLTNDHVTGNEKEKARILKSGGFILNERLMGILKQTRSFGLTDIKKRIPFEIISSTPESICLSLNESQVPCSISFVILASDGLFDILSNEEACEIVLQVINKEQKSFDLQLACKNLIQTAMDYFKKTTTNNNDLLLDDISVSIIAWNHNNNNNSKGKS